MHSLKSENLISINFLNSLSVGKIICNGKQFDFSQFATEFLNGSGIELRIATLIHEWQSGKEKFEVKTSGSTGPAKQIELSRSQIEWSARMTGSMLGLHKGMNAFLCLDPGLIAGKMMVIRSLVLDMNLSITEPAALPVFPENFNPDFVAFAPMQLLNLLRNGYQRNLNKMRVILVGGAPVSSELENESGKLSVPVFHSYGMTETVSHVALRMLNGPDKSDTYTAVNDIEFGKTADNCLTIRGPVTLNKLLKTNDCVDLINSKCFRWLGRIDNVINSGGIKLNPEDIEKKIGKIFQELPIQNEFFIAGMKDDLLGEKLVLVIEGDELKQDLSNQFQKSFHRYEIPKMIIYVPRFIRTSTGKIDRNRTMENKGN